MLKPLKIQISLLFLRAHPVARIDQHALNTFKDMHFFASSPVPKPGLHTHSADEEAVVLMGTHMPTGQVLLVA